MFSLNKVLISSLLGGNAVAKNRCNILRIIADDLGYSYLISRATTLIFILCFLFGATISASAQESSQDLAKKLSNPIADLIAVPIQFNYDRGIGPDGDRVRANLQPVIPFKLSDELTAISRTIVPVVYQSDIFPTAGDQFGLGDIVQSIFLSPAPIPLGEDVSFVFGAGPVFLLPTGTDNLLSQEKWGAGPTAVGLLLNGPLTIGTLANHIWSFAGDDGRADVNNTLIQPFITYTTPDAVTFSLESETTYNWETEELAVPINFTVSKLVIIDRKPISFGIGSRYWIDPATGGPDGWGARASVTFLFPAKK